MGSYYGEVPTDVQRYYDDMVTSPASTVDGWVCIDEAWRYHRSVENRAYWLVVDDIAVAYAEVMWHGDYPEENQLVLCDIEIREEFQGHGFARKLVAEIEALEGRTLWTTGHFTPKGEKALGFLPILPWEEKEAGVWFKDQTFVANWDALVSKSSSF